MQLAIHRSRKLIPPLTVEHPVSAIEAFSLWRQVPGSEFLAGGIDVLNRLKYGIGGTTLIALDSIAELRGISLAQNGIRQTIEIGAMTRHDEIARSPLVVERLPGLAVAWDRIANIRIRMQGTVGGNLLAREQGYEAATILAAHGATMRFLNEDGSGYVPMGAPPNTDDASFASTQRGLLLSLSIPLPAADQKLIFLYDRTFKPELVVGLAMHSQGRQVLRTRCVLGGCYAKPLVNEWAGEEELGSDSQSNAHLARSLVAGLPPSVPALKKLGNEWPHVAGALLRRLVRTAAAEHCGTN